MILTTPASADIQLHSYGIQMPWGPPSARYVVDVTGFRDPMGVTFLKETYKDGTDLRVQEWIRRDPRVETVIQSIRLLAHSHLKSNRESWTSIGFKDHHGVWIAPAVAEMVGRALSELDHYSVYISHRGIQSRKGPGKGDISYGADRP